MQVHLFFCSGNDWLLKCSQLFSVKLNMTLHEEFLLHFFSLFSFQLVLNRIAMEPGGSRCANNDMSLWWNENSLKIRGSAHVNVAKRHQHHTGDWITSWFFHQFRPSQKLLKLFLSYSMRVGWELWGRWNVIINNLSTDEAVLAVECCRRSLEISTEVRGEICFHFSLEKNIVSIATLDDSRIF